MKWILCILFVATYTRGAVSQTACTCTIQPIFEIVSIHRSAPTTVTSDLNFNNGEILARGVSITFLLQKALNVREFQVKGVPHGLEQERFDISTRGQEDQKAAQWDQCSNAEQDAIYEKRLSEMLVSRFNLRYVVQEQGRSGFRLSLGKSGLKLKVNTDGGGYLRMRTGEEANVIEAKSAHMADVASLLSTVLDRNVVDTTNLPNGYDFELRWSSEMNGQSSTAPSIFTAVREQLGLQLEHADVPTKIVTVERVTMPSEN